MFINETESETMNEPNDEHQQRQSQHFYSRIFENGRFHKSHIEILTFLKSNYKFKRRNCTATNALLLKTGTELNTNVDGTIKCTVAPLNGASDKTYFCHHHHENITQKLKTKSDKFFLELINLSLVVVFIVANFLHHKLKSSLWLPSSDFVQLAKNSSDKEQNITNFASDDDTLLHDDDDDYDDGDNESNANDVNILNAVNVGDFANEDDDDNQHDIDGNNYVTTSDNNNVDVNDDSDETCCQPNYDKLSTLGCHHQQQQQKQQQQQQRRLPLQHHHNEWLRHQWISLLQLLRCRGSASSSPLLLSVEIHTQLMSIFMALFIALALSVRYVEGGACWQKTLYNGKCNEIFSLNITKAECCGTNQEFSYTDRELTSVEYFFATAIGGGMECAPCLESCKNVNCGPNKKCAKRKGRPKCICAPECGAAVRRRQKMKLFKGATQPHLHHHHHQRSSDSMFSPVQRNLESAVIFGKSARDIRSLSSEIQSQNLGLTEEDEENLSQRKFFIMQSGEGGIGIGGQLKSPMKGGVEMKKRKRLLIVEAREQQHADKPTTRRLQVISNTNNKNSNHHGNKRKKSTKLHKQNHQEEEVVDGTQGKNIRDSSSATAISAATTTTALQSTSRHKFNANNNNSNKNMQQQQQHQQQTKNFDAKLRHIHQNSRQQLEVEDTPNHHDQQQQHHGRHHQFRKRKKKLHNKLKQDQHDVVENADNATTVVLATMSGTRTIKATTSSTSTTSTTPVNSSVTEDQRLLNHGSNIATSSSSRLASSTTSSSSSSTLSGSGDLTNIGVGGSSSGSGSSRTSHHRTVNFDDMTFDDRIYDKFNLHGFPEQEQQRITQIAKSHSSHHPVCGTDGRTYNTECQLKKRACRTDNTDLVVAYRGHCKTTCNGVKCLNGLTCVEDHYTIPHCIACKIDCPLDNDDDEIDVSRAVCGVDGKTYKSVCDINRMICKIGRSIAVAYPGPCRDDHVTCSDINCGPKRMCLIDLLTHEPRCVSCRYKCSRKRRPTSLRYEEGKICGANNRTYNSWCEMRKDSCATGFFIDVKTFGECQ